MKYLGPISDVKDIVNKGYVDSLIPQAETMPTASAEYKDRIIQYVGDDTEDYTKAYFYLCKEDTGTTPYTYAWAQIYVQPGGSGNYVTVDTEQTITGEKTFRRGITLLPESQKSQVIISHAGIINLCHDMSSNTSLEIDAENWAFKRCEDGDTYFLTLPAKDGVFATTDDIKTPIIEVSELPSTGAKTDCYYKLPLPSGYNFYGSYDLTQERKDAGDSISSAGYSVEGRTVIVWDQVASAWSMLADRFEQVAGGKVKLYQSTTSTSTFIISYDAYLAAARFELWVYDSTTSWKKIFNSDDGLLENCLKKTGDTLTGVISTSLGQPIQLTTDSSYYLIQGGKTTTSCANLKLNGGNVYSESEQGQFSLTTKKVNSAGTVYSKELIGNYTNGLTWDGEQVLTESALDDYLPLAGGTMTGSIIASERNIIIRSDTDSYVAMIGGPDANNGGSVTCRGKDSSDGQVQIRAKSSSAYADYLFNADSSFQLGNNYSVSSAGVFTKKINGDFLISSSDSYSVGIKSGTNYKNGAHLDLYAKDNTGKGIAVLSAADGTNINDLTVKPDGTAILNNKNVVTNNWQNLTVTATSGFSYNTNYTQFKYNESMIFISFVDAVATSVPSANLVLTFTMPSGFKLLTNQARSTWSTSDGTRCGVMFNSGTGLAVQNLAANVTFSGQIIIPITKS